MKPSQVGRCCDARNKTNCDRVLCSDENADTTRTVEPVQCCIKDDEACKTTIYCGHAAADKTRVVQQFQETDRQADGVLQISRTAAFFGSLTFWWPAHNAMMNDWAIVVLKMLLINTVFGSPFYVLFMNAVMGVDVSPLGSIQYIQWTA